MKPTKSKAMFTYCAIVFNNIIKPGARGRTRAPGFLKLLWFACRYVCMCVYVSAPEAINNQWHDIDHV